MLNRIVFVDRATARFPILGQVPTSEAVEEFKGHFNQPKIDKSIIVFIHE